MARMQGFGRKREEEERKRAQQQAADNPQNSAVIRGREHAKETANALTQTGHKIVAEQNVNPFEQTAGKTNAQLLADYDAEMAGREGMAMGMTPRRDLGTRAVEVDFSTIKDNKQAAYFAGTLANEDVAEEFLKDWAAYSEQDSDEVLYNAEGLLGDKLFAAPRSERGKNAAKTDAAMKTLASGLVMDADGNDMDLASASLPMVIQSIRADPDSSSRKAKVKALYELTQTPGNPYSGMTFDENQANTFLYSADWDDKDYKDAVDKYQSAFYAGSGHDEENLAKFLELADEISVGEDMYGEAYSQRQQKSMRAALDKAWTSATGLRAPTDEDIAAWNELNQTAQAEGKKASPLVTFVTWLFGDKDKKAEKESARENSQPEQASTLDQIASTDGVKRAALTASTAPGIALPQEQSKDGGRWINQLLEKQKDAGAQMQAQFGGAKNGGNVDLTKRPQVSYENMAAAGWGDYTEPGGVSTVLTTGYGTPADGFVAQMTPIREDGSVLTPEELDAYYDSVREAVRQGKNIAEADPEHLVLASKHGTPEELAKEKDWLESYGEKLHQAQEAYYAETPTQAEKQAQAAEGTRWFDQIYERETPTPIAQRESVSTPGEAVMLYLKGEPLTQEEHEWLDDILNSNGGMLLLNQKEYVGGTLTNGMDYRAKPLYAQGAIPSDVGSWIQQDLDILKSGMLDDATAGAGYLALMQIINDADAWIESGEGSIPSGQNPYNVYLSTHDGAKAVSQSISEAQIIAIEQQKSAAQAQKQAEAEANQSLVNAVTSGTATPEQIDEYYDRYHRHQYTVLELENRDEGYRNFDRNLSIRLNADDGAYWSSDSAAAQEGLEGEARTEFREVLADEAQSVLHEYADIANSLGMTTREYLEKCGVTSPDQIADMAYNRMVRRGSAFLSSETAQAGLTSPEDNAATIGVLPAAGAGAAYGVLSTADSLASAPYNMLDAMAYKANVNEIRSDYNGKYGINGRAIYREQLIQYANSGELSEEQSAALLQNIGQVSDIYDIGYKIDNGFIGNKYRAFMGADGFRIAGQRV